MKNGHSAGRDASAACVIAVRHACTRAHLAACGNLLCEPENYSVVADYHSPAQQPHFSGALKVTRVEQMAQFPQSFWINESLLQRNANFQTLDCFPKTGRGRGGGGGISFSHFRNRLIKLCSCINQFHRMFPLHNRGLIGFGLPSGGLVCGKSTLFGISMLQRGGIMQLPVYCTLISLLCYVGQLLSQPPLWNEGYFSISMLTALSNKFCLCVCVCVCFWFVYFFSIFLFWCWNLICTVDKKKSSSMSFSNWKVIGFHLKPNFTTN